MNEQRVQTSEALRVGLVLALAGGYLDAYTYLCGAECSPTPRPATWCCWA